MIELISETFSSVDYHRKSEIKLRRVRVRNVGDIDTFSDKLRLPAENHYGLDNTEAADRNTSKRRYFEKVLDNLENIFDQ